MDSIVPGNSAFIERSKWSRKIIGGGIRASGVMSSPARVAIDDVFLGGKLNAPHDQVRRATALWEQLGRKFELPTQTNMVWLDLKASRVAIDDFYPVAPKFDIKLMNLQTGRLVFHYQSPEAAFSRLWDFLTHVVKNRQPAASANGTLTNRQDLS